MRITTYSVYHAELDEEGRTQPLQLPMIPRHEVIRYIDALGNSVDEPRLGERVGIGRSTPATDPLPWAIILTTKTDAIGSS